MIYHFPIPPLRIRVGCEVVKRGETLMWKVSAIDEDTVELNGPGACRGRMIVTKEELNRDWVRA